MITKVFKYALIAIFAIIYGIFIYLAVYLDVFIYKGILYVLGPMLPLTTWIVPLIIMRNKNKFGFGYIILLMCLNIVTIPLFIKYFPPENGFKEGTWLTPKIKDDYYKLPNTK